MHTAIAILVVIVTLIINVMAVAQVMRYRTVDGLSISAIAMGFCICSSWSVYGFATAEPAQIVANGFAAICKVIVLYVAYRKGVFTSRQTGLILITGIVVTASALISGASGIASVVSTIMFVSGIPQIVVAVRSPGGFGVSVSSMAIGALVSIGWALEGFLHHDIWVVSTSLYCVALNSFIVFRTLQGRRQVVVAAEVNVVFDDATVVAAAA